MLTKMKHPQVYYLMSHTDVDSILRNFYFLVAESYIALIRLYYIFQRREAGIKNYTEQSLIKFVFHFIFFTFAKFVGIADT